MNYADAVELVVANPVSSQAPPQLNRIMVAGYTTKGAGHGQGLRTVQDIIAQTPGAALQLALKHDRLYFTVILLKSGGEWRDNGKHVELCTGRFFNGLLVYLFSILLVFGVGRA
ncbi:hypothetical protein L3X07_05230 [Levilactobacillus brevis]|nr:hypothetical protein [Levilactobacillus brevis]